MFSHVSRDLMRSWKSLLITDLIFRVITFVALAPLVSLLLGAFLSMSGREVLADVDIVKFMVHPLGWSTLIVVGGASVGLFALELAALVIVCVGARTSRLYPPLGVINFVLLRIFPVLRVTIRIVLKLSVICVPFLICGGLLYWLLLTKYDINFYLSQRPPAFVVAVASIGSVLAIMTALVARKLCGWCFALPLLLVEKVPPADCLEVSWRRSEGKKWKIGLWLLTWLIVALLFSSLTALCTTFLGRLLIIPLASNPWTLSLAAGLAVCLLLTSNLISNIFANVTLAATLTSAYLQEAAVPNQRMPYISKGVLARLSLRLGLRRGYYGVAAGLAAGLVVLGLGVYTVQSFQVEDQVQITAHRGGAFDAPENTMAAIRSAIDAEADWVEIDVQESKDGIVMVAHDSDLKKVANNPIKIWEASAEQLRQVDIGGFFSAEFVGEKMPTLDEVLIACKDKVGVNIELKYYGHDMALEQKVVDLVEMHGMQDQIVIMSLKRSGIEKIKAMRPAWSCGLLTAVAIGDLTKVNADFLAVKSSLATKRFVRASHSRGKPVAAWTVNEPVEVSALLSRGVDNLITDDPRMVRQVLEERKAMSTLERAVLELSVSLGIHESSTSR